MISKDFVGSKEVEEILEKHPSGVTSAEIDILIARRSYLTEEELNRFGLDMEGNVVTPTAEIPSDDAPVETDKGEEVPPADADAGAGGDDDSGDGASDGDGSGTDDEEVDLNKLKLTELKDLAKEQEIDLSGVKNTRADHIKAIKKAIKKAEAEAQPPQEDK